MKKLIALLVILIVVGCQKAYETYFCRSFVMGYGIMYKISVDPMFYKEEELYCNVDFVGEGEWSLDMKGINREKYDALCVKHNDMSYNRRVRMLVNLFDVRCCHDFVTLEIRSSADWDAAHPAGCLLNDITLFVSDTPYPYIQSGYTKKYSEDKDGEYYPVKKPVSELTPEDMTLLPRRGFYFYFTSPPTLDRKHTLSVLLTADDGTEFTASCDVVFEK